MKVVLQYFDSCPGWQKADSHLQSVIESADLDIKIEYQRIETLENAQRFEFAGSPTVLIDGQDPWADDQLRVGLSCRTYPTPEGLQPSPTRAQIETALGVTS